jgi:hypothetical protein
MDLVQMTILANINMRTEPATAALQLWACVPCIFGSQWGHSYPARDDMGEGMLVMCSNTPNKLRNILGVTPKQLHVIPDHMDHMDLGETGLENIDWLGVGQDGVKWRALVHAVTNLWVPYSGG